MKNIFLKSRKISFVASLMVTTILFFGVSGFAEEEKKTKSEASLIGYWSFGEGEGEIAKDSSGNKNAGIIIGATYSRGKIGTGLKFDGEDDGIEVANSLSLEKLGKDNSEFTVATWVKTGEMGSAEYQPPVIAKPSRAQGWGVYLTNANRAGIHLKDIHGTEQWVWSAKLVDDGYWHHWVVVVHKTGYGEIYIDGARDVGGTGGSSTIGDVSNEKSLFIAKRESGGTYFKGSIDEIKIYNRALSKEEVELLYTTGKFASVQQTKF